jgi:calcineurin-like phosphoesterase family protein
MYTFNLKNNNNCSVLIHGHFYMQANQNAPGDNYSVTHNTQKKIPKL